MTWLEKQEMNRYSECSSAGPDEGSMDRLVVKQVPDERWESKLPENLAWLNSPCVVKLLR